jgi:hypothetical protein
MLYNFNLSNDRSHVLHYASLSSSLSPVAYNSSYLCSRAHTHVVLRWRVRIYMLSFIIRFAALSHICLDYKHILRDLLMQSYAHITLRSVACIILLLLNYVVRRRHGYIAVNTP